MSKPRVLLINPPGTRYYARDKYCNSISKASYYWPQIDLLVLSGRLKDNFDVALVDSIATGQAKEQIINTFAPLSLTAMLFLTSAASFVEDMAFVDAMKKASPDTKTIGIGGILLGRGKELLAENKCIDAGLLDFTSEHVTDYLNTGRPAPDMICRQDGQIVKGERSKQQTFAYPVPLHDQLPQGRYRFPSIATERFTVSIASVGCRYGCRFCIAEMVPYKQRELANLMEEMEAIKNQGYEHVLFHDFTFTHDRQFTSAFCNEMIAKNLGLEWTCQTRVDTVDRELLAEMKKAGCRTIQFGVESGDDQTLAQMNKDTNVAQIQKAFSLAKEQGMRTSGFFILGWPTEKKSSAKKTIRLAKKLKCDYASFTLPMAHAGTWLGSQEESKLPYSDIASQSPKQAAIIKKAYRKFYLRPSYLLKRLFATQNRYELKLQTKLFFSMFKGLLKGKN